MTDRTEPFEGVGGFVRHQGVCRWCREPIHRAAIGEPWYHDDGPCGLDCADARGDLEVEPAAGACTCGHAADMHESSYPPYCFRCDVAVAKHTYDPVLCACGLPILERGPDEWEHVDRDAPALEGCAVL